MTAYERIQDEATLEDLLSQPTPAVIQALAQAPGDLLLLGVGGKMGPSLARMALRASETGGSPRRIIGVSRFSQPNLEAQLQSYGIETIECDLLDDNACQTLPDAPNVIFMTGMKFGSTGQESRMWAMNTLVPGRLAARYPSSRWLVFSTGNVYPFSPKNSAGPKEDQPPAPVGEYGMSCLGRERVFEHASQSQGSPVSILRLNYACDLRYGVLVDLAQQVWAGQPIDLAMGYFNTIWQGDANAISLQALPRASSPPFVINLTGLQTLSVRTTAEQLGKIMGKPVRFSGHESDSALLSNATKAANLFSPPSVDTNTLIRWVAHWVMDDQPTLGKPTHFQARDGKF